MDGISESVVLSVRSKSAVDTGTVEIAVGGIVHAFDDSSKRSVRAVRRLLDP